MKFINITLSIIAFVIFTFGVLVKNDLVDTKVLSKKTEEKVAEDIQHEESEISDNVEKSPEEAETPNEPETIPTSTPSPISTSSLGFLSDFKYPNSEIVEEFENTLNLKSKDDVEKITDWYKSQITDSGKSVRNFVSTKVNGDVLNKLEGDGLDGEIKVEISKPKDQVDVDIKIQVTD